MKQRMEDRKSMKDAMLELMSELGIPSSELDIWEDTDEAFSVGFDYEGLIAVAIELGYRNGVGKAYCASYQDLKYPTDSWEEADTIEDAMIYVEGWCENAD
jgi:hypothetical protein